MSLIQISVLALFYPDEGGALFIIRELVGTAGVKNCIARVYGAYLLVGLSASFTLSFFIRNPNSLAIGILSSIAPLIRWHWIYLFFQAHRFWPYILILSPIIPLLVVTGSYLGAKSLAVVTARQV
jgi:hypothetical protein